MAWRIATAGLLALSLTRSAVALPETSLYVVNGTGLPFHMALDDRPWSPDMSHLTGSFVRAEPGRHILRGRVAGEPEAAISLDLTEGNLVTTKTHAFWCVVVGRRQDAELAFVSATQPQCAGLIQDLLKGL